MACEFLKTEWLETNGIGGFACSTIAGANTRRYHGLLTAALVPPASRYLLLSKIEETLIAGGQRFELATNFYPGAIHPEGFRYLTGFSLMPSPVFTFEAGGVRVEKHVLLAQGENTVVVEYKVNRADCRLELRPLIAFRGYHDLTHANAALNAALDESPGCVSLQPYAGLPRLFFAHNAETVRREGNWYFNFEYPVERERGLDFHEDLFCPFVLGCAVTPEKSAVVIASTTGYAASAAGSLASPRDSDPLLLAASQFVVARGPFHTIIAGYPWFTDWGRDTMISLPGITLVTGKFDLARDILSAFANVIDRGMLPNRFTDSGAEPEYNTVDATLWFFEAIRQYLAYTGDIGFVSDQLYAKLRDIVEWHIRGTRFGIHADSDGLLSAGDPGTQLTWMDARVDGVPVTPRNGKAVEIQALWYNALRFMGQIAGAASYETLAARAGKSFNEAFWNPAGNCLYDVIDGGSRDATLRPNQVIALSLGYCAIPDDRGRLILDTVARELLTPFGLRTLARQDPRYRGRYEGPSSARDAAYHQGTVWPWLLGPFIAADIRLNGLAGRDRAAKILQPLQGGQVAEIFDGDPPHQARGCFAQAWSVAEILRASRLI